MTVFDGLFGRVGFASLLTQFRESIIVELPDGSIRELHDAIVDRNPPTSFDAIEHGHLSDIVITVWNDSRIGISSDEVNTGTYRVRVSRRKGKDALSLSVAELEDDTGGICVIRLR